MNEAIVNKKDDFEKLKASLGGDMKKLKELKDNFKESKKLLKEDMKGKSFKKEILCDDLMRDKTLPWKMYSDKDTANLIIQLDNLIAKGDNRKKGKGNFWRLTKIAQEENDWECSPICTIEWVDKND
jgi:hypothetical protein